MLLLTNGVHYIVEVHVVNFHLVCSQIVEVLTLLFVLIVLLKFIVLLLVLIMLL
jgi:hypothetical protein